MEKIKICWRCGSVCSDRYKIGAKKYICEQCYKKIFIRKEEKI